MPTPEELEHAAAAEVSKALRARLEELTRKGMALAEGMGRESSGYSMLSRLLADQIDRLADDPVVEDITYLLTEAGENAFRAARADAARQLAVAEPSVFPSTQVRQRGEAASVAVRKELRASARQMRLAKDPVDVLSAFSSSRRAVTRAETAARFAVNEALSEGATAVAQTHGVSRMWVPERDACVHCLAYAGEVAGPGEDFRGGLTFGAKALVPSSASVVGAPLHPNCRCRIVPYRAELDDGRPEAYKREALRSVLRGFSLPSESERVRLDAAQRALRDASRMPKSVQDYARASVKRGAFSRGRAVPDSTQRKMALTDTQKLTTRIIPTSEAKDAPNGLASLPTRVVGSVGDERRDALSKVNPKFGEPGYGINCVHVVAAAELRRRGYDVEATPLPLALWGNRGRNMQEALDRWRTGPQPERWIDRLTGREVSPDAPRAVHVPVNEGDKRRVQIVPQVGGLQTNSLRMIREWGPGARGWVVLAWKKGGAHVFSAEVARDGKTVILTDSQTGQVVKAAGYFSRARMANVVRVDDLVPTDAVLEFVRPSGSPI